MEKLTLGLALLLAVLLVAPGIAYQRVARWRNKASDAPEGALWSWISASVSMLPITVWILDLMGVDTALLALTGDSSKVNAELMVIFGLLWKVWVAGFLVPLGLSLIWLSRPVVLFTSRIHALLFGKERNQRWEALMDDVYCAETETEAARITLHVKDGETVNARNVLIEVAQNSEAGIVWYNWAHDPQLPIESIHIDQIMNWETTT